MSSRFIYGDLESIDLAGKKVAIFGLGDQGGYGDNFCDAMDELKTCFEGRGAAIVGSWSTDGYDHMESKSIADGKFVGTCSRPAPIPTPSSPAAASQRDATPCPVFCATLSPLRPRMCAGLPCDEDNQPDQSEERVKAWVAQIKGEGMPL